MRERTISKCPWVENTDCICRVGSYCYGFDWSGGEELGQCKFYQPLKVAEINRLQTKLFNECRACKHFAKNSCKENSCGVMITLCNLEKLKKTVKPRKNKGSHITKTISGITYRGKDTK